ncbi:MAG: EAL domain-containing protein [Geminicoccaceae bacterium]|nr:EAL domain-containing protein [Geminicoccaceae bacterium]MDW8340523.1 EAL domain-containing protein [Geminicoccaceae bacterium]
MIGTGSRTGRGGAGLGVIFTLSALVLAASIGAALLLFAGTREQNRLQLAHEQELVRSILLTIEDMVVKSTKDYANWDEAYLALARGPDQDWIELNLHGAHANLGFEYSGVADFSGTTHALFVEGRRLESAAEEVLAGGLHTLFEHARGRIGESAEPVAGLFADARGAVVLAAAVVVPQTRNLLAEHGPPAYLFFFGQRLRSDLLEEASARLKLRDLRYLPPEVEVGGGEAFLPLVAVDGSDLGRLAWIAATPGDRLARTGLPMLGATTVVTTVLVLLALSQMRRATAELAASEQRFFDLATVSSDWIFETDAEGRLVFLSERSEEILGREAAGLLGARLPDLLVPIGEGGRAEGSLEARLAHPSAFRDLLCRPTASEAKARLLRLAARPVRDRKGRHAGWRGTATDVTAERRALERARYLASHDPLTGLANRARFGQSLEERLALNARSDRRLAVFLLDLDRFKDVNDTLGHAAGDELLRIAAARLSAELRASDVLARLGGDEFAILVPDLAEAEQALALAGRLLRALAEPFAIEKQTVRAGGSIGIALAPEHGRSAGDLLRNADIALYRAKALGRGQACLFAAPMAEEYRERQRLEADLRAALERGELALHYQPKFDARTGALTSCEALLRWHHPERGSVPPARFVPLAEETGLIHAIGAWVLEEACRQAVAWGGLPVAVNLSPVQLRDEELPERVRAVLEATGLPPDRLELEITETALLDEGERAIRTLRALRALGVRIAMDDFGTGHSSLGHLQRLPFDKLKIDRSFVDRLEEDPRRRAIVAAIVDLARAFGMATCAEGVETDGQLDALRRTGCEEVQGYLLARPLPAPEFSARFLGLSARSFARGFSAEPQREEIARAAEPTRSPGRKGPSRARTPPASGTAAVAGS